MGPYPLPASASGKPNAAFKPPRPVNMSKTKQTTTTNPQSSDSEGGSGKHDEDIEMHAAVEENDPSNVSSDEVTTAIPKDLLSKSLHYAFRDPATRVTKDAMLLFGRYMDVFVGEAVLRAVEERKRTMEDAQVNGGSGDENNLVFLNIEDLEKLAPQLLLDF